jgi:hypothetical protein
METMLISISKLKDLVDSSDKVFMQFIFYSKQIKILIKKMGQSDDTDINFDDGVQTFRSKMVLLEYLSYIIFRLF